jgi:ankyrin repeat protein
MKFRVKLEHIRIYFNHNGKVAGFEIMVPFSRAIGGIASDDTCASGEEFKVLRHKLPAELDVLEVYLKGTEQWGEELEKQILVHRALMEELNTFAAVPKDRFRRSFSKHPEVVGFMIYPYEPHRNGHLFLYRGENEEGVYPNVVLNLREGGFARRLNKLRVEKDKIASVQQKVADWYRANYLEARVEGEEVFCTKENFHEVQNEVVRILRKEFGCEIRNEHIVIGPGVPYQGEDICGEWYFTSRGEVLSYEKIVTLYSSDQSTGIALSEFVAAVSSALREKGILVPREVSDEVSKEAYSAAHSLLIQYVLGFAATQWYDLYEKNVEKVGWEGKLEMLSSRQIKDLFDEVSGKGSIEEKVVAVLGRLVQYEVCTEEILGRKQKILEHYLNIEYNFEGRAHHDETLLKLVEGGENGLLAVTMGEFFDDQELLAWEKGHRGVVQSIIEWKGGERIPELSWIMGDELELEDFNLVIRSKFYDVVRLYLQRYARELDEEQLQEMLEKLDRVITNSVSIMPELKLLLENPYYSKQEDDFTEFMKTLMSVYGDKGMVALMKHNSREGLGLNPMRVLQYVILITESLGEKRQLELVEEVIKGLRLDLARVITVSLLMEVSYRERSRLVFELLVRNSRDEVLREAYYKAPIMHFSVMHGSLEVVKLLVGKGCGLEERDDGRTPLQLAAADGNLEIAQFLLEKGAVLNIQNGGDSTALHFAAAREQLEMMRFLIDKGADLNAQNEEGETPLHWVENKGLEPVRLLVKSGAHLDVQDNRGRTALHLAVLGRNADLVKLLMEGGARLDIQDNDLNTALHMAAEKGESEIIELLIQNDVRLDLTNNNGRTALHLAAQSRQLEVVKLLMARRVELDVQDQKGRTALDFAACEGDIEIVRLLLEGGANPNTINLYGYMPLDWALQNDHKEIVRLLMEKGAELNVEHKGGKPALHLLIECKRTDMIALLGEVGADLSKILDVALVEPGNMVMVECLLSNIDIAKINTEHLSNIHYGSIIRDYLQAGSKGQLESGGRSMGK